MPLDLGAISLQLAGIGEAILRRREGEEERLRAALALLASPDDPAALAGKILASRSPWRPALPVEPLATKRPPAPLPAAFSVLASDGSTIEPDRHGAALCYLINIGLVALHYGPKPGALLSSEPFVGYSDDDLYITSGDLQQLISGPLLSIRRQTLEGERLVALAEQVAGDSPAVALQDGTLILNTIEGPGLERWLQESALPSLLRHYEALRERRLPLAAYTSRPRSAEVVSALRVLSCPLAAADCQNGCPATDGPTGVGAIRCRSFGGLTDRVLFARVLSPGERSPVFRSQWPISARYYGAHQIHFYYVHVGPEIARVEVPAWVATDQALLDLVHSAVVDQCERGRGYPTALMEAHERAVLRAAERSQFAAMLETALVRAGIPVSTSEKERGKRLRAL